MHVYDEYEWAEAYLRHSKVEALELLDRYSDKIPDTQCEIFRDMVKKVNCIDERQWDRDLDPTPIGLVQLRQHFRQKLLPHLRNDDERT